MGKSTQAEDRPEVANRRRRLREWIAGFPSKAEIERRFGIDAAHLYQLANSGSFGEKVAKNLCDKAGLPMGYFDQPAGMTLSPAQQDLMDAAKLASDVSDEQAQLIAALIRSSAKGKAGDGEKGGAS